MATAEVQQQIAQLAALRRQQRIWQIGYLLILLVLVAGCLFTLRNSANALVAEGAARDEFVKDLSGRLQKGAVPTIEQAGTQALHEINWQGEAQKLNRRTPELAKASETELKLLGDHLATRGKKVLDNTVTAAMKQREAKIRAMFPEATPDQLNTLLVSLTSEAKEQSEDIATHLFSHHKKVLDSIVTDIDAIQTAEASSVKAETPTWEMGLLVFDIARAELKTLETPAEPKAKKTTAKQEKKP